MYHGVSVITPSTRMRYRAARSSMRSTALKSAPSQRKTMPIAKSIRRYLRPAVDAARNSASCWAGVELRYSIEWLPRWSP